MHHLETEHLMGVGVLVEGIWLLLVDSSLFLDVCCYCWSLGGWVLCGCGCLVNVRGLIVLYLGWSGS